MIPMSKDDLIIKEIDGVSYHCKPPVGETEIALFRYFKKENKIEPFMMEAEKLISKEYKGKRLPKKKDLLLLIADKAEDLYYVNKEHSAVEESAKELDKIIDMVLVKWTGKIKLPLFPINGSSSSAYLPMKLKEEITTWYMDQAGLTEPEIKN